MAKVLASLAICAAAFVAATFADAGTAPPRCRAAQLSLALTNFVAGVGHRGVTVVLRNRSSSRCSITGYASYRLLSPKRVPMRTSVGHGPGYVYPNDPGPRHVVVLAPGRRARAGLEWSEVPTGNEPLDRPCQPSSGYLRVTPPGSKASLVASFRSIVCGHGSMMTTAFR